MIHTITVVHEVEAESWDLALEQVLRQPTLHAKAFRVKTPGRRLVHVAPSVARHAEKQIPPPQGE